jgi:hypothetical protein
VVVDVVKRFRSYTISVAVSRGGKGGACVCCGTGCWNYGLLSCKERVLFSAWGRGWVKVWGGAGCWYYGAGCGGGSVLGWCGCGYLRQV